MLHQIDLRSFKCFNLLRLPLRSLTLLTGANASGKSSVLQALVLLHQTMREHEWSSRLVLNGTAVQLGTVADVIDHVHGRRDCEIGLLSETAYYRWRCSGERDDMSMGVGRVAVSGVDGTEEGEPGKLRHLLPAAGDHHMLAERLIRLTYLTAERLGPREYYRLDDPELTSVVGARGEHAVSVLYSGRDTRVLEGLMTGDAPPTLFGQTEAWMAAFFPGCRLAIEQVPRANSVTLGIRISADTEFHRPIHTGFGLTQVLPVIVAALAAKQNDLLLIENPEVHLHPAGQAAMGRFLARVASAGIQVLIETHSDHVLNGIRRAVKGKMLSSDNVALHFFRPRSDSDVEENEVPQVESPILDPHGNIDRWPEGFFDQFDKDMNYFAGWN